MISPDLLSEPGATSLAETIRRYWDKQGKRIIVRVEGEYMPRQDSTANRPIYGVRSDLVNGMPKG